MKQPIRAGAVQMQSLPGDKDGNRHTVERFVQQAADDGVRLLVFPECCLTGYWFLRRLERDALLNLAESCQDGESVRWLSRLAVSHQMVIGAGLVEEAHGQLFNAYVVAEPDGTWAVHRKLHCFISQHLASGDAYTVVDSSLGLRHGTLICYDNNLGENVRLTALRGAEVLLAPHQTGGCHSASPHGMKTVPTQLWEQRSENRQAIEDEFRGDKGRGWLLRWLPARAHDNGLFLIFSNGVGPDDDEIRTGNAMILDPYGRILAETWAAEERLVAADLDPSLLEMSTGSRWIQARRPELYGPLAEPTGRERETRQVRFEGLE